MKGHAQNETIGGAANLAFPKVFDRLVNCSIGGRARSPALLCLALPTGYVAFLHPHVLRLPLSRGCCGRESHGPPPLAVVASRADA